MKFFENDMGDIINLDNVSNFRIVCEEGKKRMFYEAKVFMKEGGEPLSFLDSTLNTFVDDEDKSFDFDHDHLALLMLCAVKYLMDTDRSLIFWSELESCS